MKKRLSLTLLLIAIGIPTGVRGEGILGGLFDKPRAINPKAPVNPATGKPLTAYEIYGLIDRSKIKAFSTDSFRRSGADQAGVAEWNTLTDSLNDFALDRVGAANKPTLQKYITDLNNIRTYIENTIEALKSGTTRASMLAEAHKYAVTTTIIEKGAVEKIKERTTPSSAWLSQIPAENDKILNDAHKKILNDYAKMSSIATKQNKAIQDVEIAALLKLHDIKTDPQISNLINNLEQYQYKTKDSIATELIGDIYWMYPKLLSSYFIDVITNTPNKPFIIIFAQAGAYASILQQIIRELSQ